MVKVNFYDDMEDSKLKFAVIVSKSRGKWVFCKHKDRDTYECPGGHREPGEDILAAARRELFEETGAVSYSLKQIGVYSVTGEDDFIHNRQETFGMLYYADIAEFDALPEYEIEKVVLMEELPLNWTYPDIQPKLIEKINCALRSMPISLTRRQARQFLLRKQGLLGEYRLEGKEGVLAYVRQAGCIQFDPIDVCGKNAELVLQSRVKGFQKQMLAELLYEDRKLLDYFDKNLAIVSTDDWPYLECFREYYREHSRGKEEVDRIAQEIKRAIKENGPVSSKDIDFNEKVDWYWSSTKLSRAALESLYFRGELIVHHKKGTNKYYALSEEYIPKELLHAPNPFASEPDHLKWRVLRRISAVGLLWNKPSDAWLGIWDLRAAERNQVFEELVKEGRLLEITVEGCKDSFYCVSEDEKLLQEILSSPEYKERTELIAPLDCMLWDRKLIRELFGFDYKWEIYTPEVQRKYGYYVLPVLMGERFAARVEVIAAYKDKKLTVKHIWLEKDVRPTKKLYKELDKCFLRFMKFHGLKEVIYLEKQEEGQ